MTVTEKFENEMMRQNLQGHISEIAKNYHKEMYYIHRPNLAKHIGNGNSLHNWCKKQVLDSSGQEFSLSKVTCSTTSVKSMTYQEDCQCKFSFILSKTLQNKFTKLQALVELQMSTGLKLAVR